MDVGGTSPRRPGLQRYELTGLAAPVNAVSNAVTPRPFLSNCRIPVDLSQYSSANGLNWH